MHKQGLDKYCILVSLDVNRLMKSSRPSICNFIHGTPLSRVSIESGSSSFQYLQSIKNNGKPKYLQKVCFDLYEQIDERESITADAIQAGNLKTSKHYDDV